VGARPLRNVRSRALGSDYPFGNGDEEARREEEETERNWGTPEDAAAAAQALAPSDSLFKDPPISRSTFREPDTSSCPGPTT
jgi:hypothetical protein